jgi:hypothetical protein
VTANFADKVGPGLLRRVRRSAAAGEGKVPAEAQALLSKPVPDFLPLPLLLLSYQSFRWNPLEDNSPNNSWPLAGDLRTLHYCVELWINRN